MKKILLACMVSGSLAAHLVAQQVDSTVMVIRTVPGSYFVQQDPSLQPVPQTTLKAGEFNTGLVQDAMQLVQGRVAGLLVAKPNGDPNASFEAQIHGLNTMFGRAAPLMVVDGMPGYPLNMLDPNDVESITVLRDASAMAPYGVRGASGVVLITTKTGSSKKPHLQYSAMVGQEQIAKTPGFMSANEFVANGGYDEGSSTDWLGLVTQNKVSQAHSLSYGNVTKGFQYNASLHYRNTQGVLRGSGFESYSGRLNLFKTFIGDRLAITANVSATSRNADYGFREAFRYANTTNPTAPVNETNPEYGGYYQRLLFDYYNPVAIVEQNSNTGRENLMYAQARARFKYYRNHYLEVSYGILDFNGTYAEKYDAASFFRYWPDGWSIENQSRFNIGQGSAVLRNLEGLRLGNHFKLWYNLGVEQMSRVNYAGSSLDNSFPYHNYMQMSDMAAIDLKGVIIQNSSYEVGDYIQSGFGNLHLTFRDRLFVTASYRADNSNRFGENISWNYYPSVTGGVDLAKILNKKPVNELRLSAGWAHVGLLPVNPRMYTPIYGQPDPILLRYGNPDLMPEHTTGWNVTLAGRLFDKLRFSANYYNEQTSDILLLATLPTPAFGAAQKWLNAVDFNNKGWDIALGYTLEKGNLRWNTDLNLSLYRSEVTDLGGGTFPFYTSMPGPPGFGNIFMQLYEAGTPVGMFWAPVLEKIDEFGNYVFKDLDKDGLIEIDGDDRQNVGQGLPTSTWGWYNSLVYGKFDLRFLLRGVRGHSLYNANRTFYERDQPIAPTDFNLLRTEYYLAGSTYGAYSDRVIERADFIRLDNLAVGYTLKLKKIEKIRLFVAANNLLTISDYSGTDPEVRLMDEGESAAGNLLPAFKPAYSPGLDRRVNYLTTRTFSVGIQVGI